MGLLVDKILDTASIFTLTTGQNVTDIEPFTLLRDDEFTMHPQLRSTTGAFWDLQILIDMDASVDDDINVDIDVHNESEVAAVFSKSQKDRRTYLQLIDDVPSCAISPQCHQRVHGLSIYCIWHTINFAKAMRSVRLHQFSRRCYLLHFGKDQHSLLGMFFGTNLIRRGN